MARDVEHFFMCFGHLDFFGKALFSSFTHSFIESLIFGGVYFFELLVYSYY
jgi:hypothetical protein